MHPKDTLSDPGIATFRFSLLCVSFKEDSCDHAEPLVLHCIVVIRLWMDVFVVI